MLATVCAGLAAQSARGRQRRLDIDGGRTRAGGRSASIWAYYELVRHGSPFPSVADAAYLLYPVGACAALLLCPAGRPGQARTASCWTASSWPARCSKCRG